MKTIYWAHALLRMFQRKISADEVHHVLATGTTIEEYPEDKSFPSRLILGWRQQKPYHLVVAENVDDDQVIVITIYEPDPAQWSADYRQRLT